MARTGPSGGVEPLPAPAEGLGELNDHPGHLARRLHQMTYVVWAQVVSETVTPPQFVVLQVVSAYPGIDQTGLSEHSHFDQSTIADVIRRLLAKGYITRERDAADHRRNLLTLTETGAAVLEELRVRTSEMNAILLETLDPDEQKTFLKLARRIIDATERLVPKAGRRTRQRVFDGTRRSPS